MNIEKNPSVVVIGSVNSTRKTIEKLLEHKITISAILGLDPFVSKNVSGYADLKQLAKNNGIPFQYFKKVNSEDSVGFLKDKKVDFLFVVGLSQMVLQPLLELPKYICIGFHPTKLPKGRGRGAVAWIILGYVEGAATFFKMDSGMDTGDIWAQESFETKEDDYAQNVVDKIVNSIDKALDRVLPDLKNGNFITIPQIHNQASYLGKRSPEDGLINWEWQAEKIQKLIRATSHPLPGSYTYKGLTPLRIYKASISEIKNHIGIPGRIIISNEKDGIHVQTGSGLLKIEEFQGVDKDKLKVGHNLGFQIEKEFFKVLHRLEIIDNNENIL
jgi:methionyl-tRNA formyltransferase